MKKAFFLALCAALSANIFTSADELTSDNNAESLQRANEYVDRCCVRFFEQTRVGNYFWWCPKCGKGNHPIARYCTKCRTPRP